MPPPYSKDGYSQVPQTPPGQQQPGWQQPTQGYAPAPPVLNQQSSNTVRSYMCHDNKIVTKICSIFEQNFGVFTASEIPQHSDGRASLLYFDPSIKCTRQLCSSIVL